MQLHEKYKKLSECKCPNCTQPRKTQRTSLDAFYKIQDKLGAKQQQVLSKYVKWYPMSFSDYDMAKMLRWPINCVTPRRGELCAKGLLECVGHRLNTDTQMENNVYRCKK